MQRKNILYIIVVSFFIISCNSERKEIQRKIDKEWYKYVKALELNDLEVAKYCVYEMIALDSNNHTYYDTLARLYFSTKNLSAAKKSAEKALAFNFNEPTLNIAYASSVSLKNTEDIALFGEMLLKSSPDSIPLLYEMAFNYIQLYDYSNAEKLLNSIILNPESITQTYNEYRGNGVQTLPYRSTSYNLLGFINNELNKPEIAKQMFKSALDISPEYILAKENYELINRSLNLGK